MSLYGSFLSDEQLQCSICLDIFTNPSSTPCGHSFCMDCISRYWDGTQICQCPLCKKTFQKRPDLQINRTLREITEQFRWMTGGGMGREKRGGGGRDGGMPDDLLVELARKMLRALPKTPGALPSENHGEPVPVSPSFTTSLASSVPNHSPLSAMSQTCGPPPPPSSGRRRFTVSGAASSQNIPLCDVHNRGILIYCRTDGVCICPTCETEAHQGHDTVTVEAEWMENKAQLQVSVQDLQEMIRQRLCKMEELRQSVSELEAAVEQETAGSLRVFSALVSAIERSQAELMEVMEMTLRAAEHRVNAMIQQLQLEVEELQRRGVVLTELMQSDDYIHCVKTYSTINSPPSDRDWSEVSVTSDLGTGTIYRSLAALLDRFQDQLRSIADTGFPPSLVEPSPSRALTKTRRMQEYAVDVTLDSNTAHPRLVLSDDMKSVWCVDRHQGLPDNVERFDRVVCVLGRDAISSGRHYWEVQVAGKTDWDLGVARQSINRKGKVDVTPSNGYWFLSLRDKNRYAFRTEPSTSVHLNLQPNKIGIFVDFERGQVSFYNVDARIHIYTFNDTFTECIYPFFSPCTNKCGKNDRPLIITPVSLTE